MLGKLFEESGFAKKDRFIVVFLLVNAFAWFFMAPILINKIIESNVTGEQELIISSTYYIGIVLSSIMGATLANKINRIKFIYTWIIFGILASLAPILFTSFTLIDCLVISFFLGASFGLGIPSCLSYFADVTHFENRGRLSGITLLVVNLVAPIFYIASSPSSGLDLNSISILFATWRLLGLTIFFLKPKETSLISEKKQYISFSEILKDKTFCFYIIAWIMFCLVDRIAGPIVGDSLGDTSSVIIIVGPIIASVSALITGIIADWIGRKRIVLYGFILLGIAYAIIGIFPTDLTKYLFIVINSITTGILLVTFIIILWGDISKPGSRAKYYTLGEMPLFLTVLIENGIFEYVTNIPEERIFPVAAFFLFLAILPILYAPETLPEKKMELRRLRNFAEDAKKAKEIHERKNKL